MSTRPPACSAAEAHHRPLPDELTNPNWLPRFVINEGDLGEDRESGLVALPFVVAIGKVLARLPEPSREGDTLIFFLSDNGGPTTRFSASGSQNRPLRGSKGDTWDGGIHVPFLVQWKGHLPAGTVYNHPVIALDIAATAVAAAGISPKPEWQLDGVNLLPFLEGNNPAPPHQSLYGRFGAQMAARQGDWMLVRPSRGAGEYEDIARDPLLSPTRVDTPWRASGKPGRTS